MADNKYLVGLRKSSCSEYRSVIEDLADQIRDSKIDPDKATAVQTLTVLLGNV